MNSPLANWHLQLRERPSVAATFAEFDAAVVRMGDVAGAYRRLQAATDSPDPLGLARSLAALAPR